MTLSYAPRSLKDVLITLLQEHHINESELARSINMPRATINRITSGKVSDPKSSTLMLIANYFGISIDQLLGHERINLCEPLKFMPKVQAPLLDLEQISNLYKKSNVIKVDAFSYEKTVEFRYKHHNSESSLFALQVRGDAMWPYFDENSIIVIDTNLEPQNRSFVLSYIADSDEMILRQLLIDVKSKVLAPINTAFNPITINSKDSIIGVVVHVEKTFNNN